MTKYQKIFFVFSFFAVLFFGCFFIIGSALADTHYVKAGGSCTGGVTPCETSIANAITNAENGDTIQLEGDFNENITLNSSEDFTWIASGTVNINPSSGGTTPVLDKTSVGNHTFEGITFNDHATTQQMVELNANGNLIFNDCDFIMDSGTANVSFFRGDTNGVSGRLEFDNCDFDVESFTGTESLFLNLRRRTTEDIDIVFNENTINIGDGFKYIMYFNNNTTSLLPTQVLLLITIL